MASEEEGRSEWRSWFDSFRTRPDLLREKSEEHKRVCEALDPSLAAWELALYVLEFWHVQFQEALKEGMPKAVISERYEALLDAVGDFSVIQDRVVRAFDMLRKHHPAQDKVVSAYIRREETQDAIAQQLGITQAAVSQRLKRALALMAMYLEANETKEREIIAALGKKGIKVAQTDEKVTFTDTDDLLVMERRRGERDLPRATEGDPFLGGEGG